MYDVLASYILLNPKIYNILVQKNPNSKSYFKILLQNPTLKRFHVRCFHKTQQLSAVISHHFFAFFGRKP